MTNAVIITGHSGGIGRALVSEFKKSGYFTIGIDRERSGIADVNIACDLSEIVNSKESAAVFSTDINQALQGKELKTLVNNAAIQILGDIAHVELDEFRSTLDVNLTAPFFLSKLFYPRLKKSKGSILNIGSIHANLTKPKFISYATSKAALKGLTQAMAVDFGQYVRVNIIQPAAVHTEMLASGFEGNPEGYKRLESYHPSNCIGTPEEIARIAVFLSDNKMEFVNGASINIDGAIGVRLHDPD